MQKMESKKIKQKKQQQMKKTLFELPTMLSLAVTLQKMSAFMGLGGVWLFVRGGKKQRRARMYVRKY